MGFFRKKDSSAGDIQEACQTSPAGFCRDVTKIDFGSQKHTANKKTQGQIRKGKSELNNTIIHKITQSQNNEKYENAMTLMDNVGPAMEKDCRRLDGFTVRPWNREEMCQTPLAPDKENNKAVRHGCIIREKKKIEVNVRSKSCKCVFFFAVVFCVGLCVFPFVFVICTLGPLHLYP